MSFEQAAHDNSRSGLSELLALVGVKDGMRVVPEPDMGSISFQEGIIAIHDSSPVLTEAAGPLPADG
jgi:hypothetical protein